MTLSEELIWRGFINQSTFADLSELDTRNWVFYHGFDASSDSQTVGNLAAMMFDKLFMRHGHKAIILAGGATSLVGDPGGKNTERELQDESVIASNIKKAKVQLNNILFGHEYTLVNNLDWTKDLKLLDFLRDIGKHFSMTQLVQRDFIAQRMGEGGSGISYTEFSYTLLQGMDFLHLYDNFGVTLQLGGSDQWGNCISGVDLIRKTRGAEVHVITLPLIINKATGHKFGKSEDGAVWLDEQKTSVYQFYQFWLNVDDEGVGDYLKIYTELNKSQIDKILSDFHQNPSQRLAQKTLAYEVTKIVHGEERAESIKRITNVLFGQQNIFELRSQDFAELALELPVYKFIEDKAIVDLLVDSKLATSKTDARRFVDNGAVYINGIQLKSDKGKLEDKDFINGYLLLRRGKNNQVLLTKF